jgi:hypothetical protein
MDPILVGATYHSVRCTRYADRMVAATLTQMLGALRIVR